LISFLVGSGISIAAEMPGVEDLTRHVLSGENLIRYAGTFAVVEDSSRFLDRVDDGDPTLQFVRHLRELAGTFYSRFGFERDIDYEDPGGVANQNDGGIVQVLSRLLVEQLRISQTNVTSSDFVSYPILRFKDSPKVTSLLLQRSDVPPQGVGQEVTDVAAAAVANAFFDATGVRMRTAPMTPARVRAVLKAGGNGTAGVK